MPACRVPLQFALLSAYSGPFALLIGRDPALRNYNHARHFFCTRSVDQKAITSFGLIHSPSPRVVRTITTVFTTSLQAITDLQTAQARPSTLR